MCNPIPGRSASDDLPGINQNEMKQKEEKKNAEELLEIINEGTKKILDLAGIASHFGEDVANHMKDRLEEKKDEKRGN